MAEHILAQGDKQERYSMANLVKWDTSAGSYDALDSTFFQEIRALPLAGTKLILEDEFAPDLLSFLVYGGTHDFWQLLMVYNDLSAASDLTRGLVIKYPRLADIETLYFGLISRKRARGQYT